jgi:Viral BACON domain
MRQNIRELLLFPIGFCMVSILSGPMIVSNPTAFAATENSSVSPTPKSRLMSGMPPLRRLVTPPSPAPAIALNAVSFSFNIQQGDSPPPPQLLTVSNRGGGTLNWNATTNVAWLTLSPASGTGNGTVTITPVLGSLAAATYTGNITLSAPGAPPVSIPVTFTVTPPPVPPAIGVSATSLSFTAQQNGSTPAAQLLSIRNTGGGTLNWTASDNAAWLTLSAAAGTGNGTVTITPILGSLAAATYTGNITLSAPGAPPVSIPVTFTVTPPTTSVALSPSSLTYTGMPDGSRQTITVTANGNWTASVNATWLKLSTTSGSGNGTIIASVDTSQANQGPNQTTITVTSGGVIKTVSITLTISSGPFATLTWKANNETDLAGYKVYRSTVSGRYEPKDVIVLLQKNVTTYQATGLQPRTTYFFVVTAFDLAGNESGYSNQVSKSIY